MHPIKLEQFEGPLELLLQLIEGQKLDITQVSLANVADQYLAYIHAQSKWDPDELADFLVIAAKLLLIKSKVLLPNLDLGDDEGDALALEQQLKMLKRYLEASAKVDVLFRRHHVAFAREKLPRNLIPMRFVAPPNLTATLLPTLFQKILERIAAFLPLPKSIIEKAASLEETIRSIRDHLMERLETSFQNLIGNAKTKTEIIVSFLAILELVKQRMVMVDQKHLFADIQIQKITSQ
ncbi:MAG: segregation/condensation protein A [bacterium]|nr:segregation/condensation protein A [bacterium]